MKKLIFALATLTSLSTFADWSGDILCTQPLQSKEHSQKLYRFVADAKGRINVKMIDDMPVAEVTFNDIRLYGTYGKVRGSVFTEVSVRGEVNEGNEMWFSNTLPVNTNATLKSIELNLSTLEPQLTIVKTKIGRSYPMNCVVRKD